MIGVTVIRCINCDYRAEDSDLRIAVINRGQSPRCPQCHSRRWGLHPHGCTCGIDHSRTPA